MPALLLILSVVWSSPAPASEHVDEVRGGREVIVFEPSGEKERAAAENLPTVSVEVDPKVFSPNGNGRHEKTEIRVTTIEPVSLVVRVVNKHGRTRRRWERDLDAPGTLTIEWRGRGRKGVLRDGRYLAVARGTDALGVSSEGSDSVVIDTRGPRIRWRDIEPEPISRQRQMRFDFRIRDRAQEMAVRLSLLDRVAKVGGVDGGNLKDGAHTLDWRPRYRRGGLLYPGLYRALLVAVDDVGNVNRGERTWRVQRSMRARVFRRLDGAGRRVALTFDDCHFPGAWSRILHVLRSKHVEAAFFCPGTMVRGNPTLARRTAGGGHVAASHAWDHALLTGKSFSAVAGRLRADARAWWNAAREWSVPYFRPPYGAYNSTVLRAAGATSHPRVIMWDVDASDYTRPGSSIITSRILSAARPGSIILLHTMDQTASALPSIIDGLRRRHLALVSLPRLFRAAGYR